VDWFWSPFFKMDMERKWYLKFHADGILWVLMTYCFARVALRYGTYLFLTAVVFFVYHVIDELALFWSFKENHWFYWNLLATCIVLIRHALKPIPEKALAKIKSIF